MHILFREQLHLDEAAAAVDLGQSPADVVLLSFSDADLGAAAMAWRTMRGARPGLRLANLAQLRHPLSVDLYVEQVLSGAKTVIIRLLGGVDYWRYGCEEVLGLCRTRGKSLAVIAGDGHGDARLREFSTVPSEALSAFDGYCREGGPGNWANALRLAASLAGLGQPPEDGPVAMARFGEHPLPVSATLSEDAPLAVLVFYRSHLLSGDIAPVEMLAEALEQRGMRCRAVYVDSLKSADAAGFAAARLRAWRPAVVLNATAFSARGQNGEGSPLDEAGCVVLQLILAASTGEAWRNSVRGLSPSDMAMQIILPECDGRLSTSAISFKTPGERVEGLEFVQTIHKPAPAQIALVADRAAGWVRLASAVPGERRVGVVLSDYPGAAGVRGQVGHAVGLDSFASLDAMADLLCANGYDVPMSDMAARLREAAPEPFLALAEYEELFAAFPAEMRERVCLAWGAPGEDPALRDGWFVQPHVRAGKLVVAVQPDRGAMRDRKASYHDADLPPRHGYIAFYLWLRRLVHALVHLGAHGTLEWLPGKALAPDPEACFPAVLCGGLPVIYPFIVNNPGEAAVARRRLGAVVLGHLTPPLKSAGVHGEAAALERLIDEYAAADGLDRRRTAMLREEILSRAEAAGLLAESGCARDMPEDDALARLDAYLCDVKDLQIRDGLHVFGLPPTPERRDALLDAIHAASPGANRGAVAAALDASAAAEGAGLLAALDGRFVAPGPAGAPSRGRADVLPTGRNLYSLDPRTTPTRAAVSLARKTADSILRRHLQDHGDWPRSLVIDLWGSAALRTGGEDLALAFILMGAMPVWDDGSSRIGGVEILPLAALDRPRVDVTLRISGLFRDAFETQMQLFDMAVQGIAARDEPDDWNGLAKAARGLQGREWRRATARIFGAAPGVYGAGVPELIHADAFEDNAELGRAYLAASSHAYGENLDGASDASGFADRVAGADGFIHQQDHAEIDILDGLDFAGFEGGFAAAAEYLGGAPALYHVDTSRNDAPRVRMLSEEIVRIVRGRAANPAWIAGMMRNDYRGAGEIGRALDGLYAFAATVPERFDRQFDLMFDATLGNPEVDAFLRCANPAAYQAMLARFRNAAKRGFWRSRRNSVAERLAAGER